MAAAERIVATILGCGSSGGVPRIGNIWGLCNPENPRNRRRRCALLVEGFSKGNSEPTRIVIDTGCDLREQMLDSHVDRIDAVFYTHEHADHTHGIDDLRVLALNNRRRVDVYFSHEAGERIREAFGYCFTSPPGSDYPPILDAHVIDAGEEISIDGPGGTIVVRPFRQEHGSIFSLGYRIGGFAYSCDLSGIPMQSRTAVSGLDVWVIDALRPLPHPSHLSLPESLALIAQQRPRQAILTNLHIDMDYASVATQTPPNVAPAFDGMRIDITAGANSRVLNRPVTKIAMPTAENETIFAQAVQVLRANDRGAYTVPTDGLYPFQWNWDSCLTALGQGHYDELRAWTEIETLVAHQWPDGMVPHIVFHVDFASYFPGPDVWRTGRAVPTSGITQPPVAGFAVKRLFDRARNRPLAEQYVRRLVPKIDAWHHWFYADRDPHGEGLVAIVHPWESGRDNSIDWDEALARVPIEGVGTYTRRDTQHADPAHRPTQAQYDRYLWLVQHFRNLGWDNARLHDASPFRVVDPGFNAILIRSADDLAEVADAIGEHRIADDNRSRAEAGRAALESLWSDTHGQYLCLDRVTGHLVDNASIGGLLPIFAGLEPGRAGTLAGTIARQLESVRYGVASQAPSDPRFEPKRYWRGPTWLITNYLIADGFAAAGQHAVADAIKAASLDLIRRSGFAEYYDPQSGEPCGGGRFSWTAAMVLEFLTGS